MIRVIIERQVKEGEDISSLLRKLRAAALQYPGYITGESLISTEDSSNIVVLSTWQTLDAWKGWQKSQIREGLEKQVSGLLVKEPRVKTYSIMSTEHSV
jgi:heme-degrading monooxygenase HmoA